MIHLLIIEDEQEIGDWLTKELKERNYEVIWLGCRLPIQSGRLIPVGLNVFWTIDEKGVGIGLSIVEMMIKTMGLKWEIETGQQGTTIKIKKRKA